MSVIVRLTIPFDGIPDEITHAEGSYTDTDGSNNLAVYDKDDVEIAIYHRDHWVFARVEKTEESK